MLLILSSQRKDYFVLCVIKPLYSIAKAGNHWFGRYLDHHKEKLGIKILTYNTCLLITKDKDVNFGITKLQINNTFNIKIEAFINKKKTETIEAKFKAK